MSLTRLLAALVIYSKAFRCSRLSVARLRSRPLQESALLVAFLTCYKRACKQACALKAAVVSPKRRFALGRSARTKVDSQRRNTLQHGENAYQSYFSYAWISFVQSLSLRLFLVSGLENEKIHIGRIDLSPGELSTLWQIDLRAKRSDTSQASANREGSEGFIPLLHSLCSNVKHLFCGIIYVWVYSTDTYLYPCIKLSNSGCGTEKRISGGF